MKTIHYYSITIFSIIILTIALVALPYNMLTAFCSTMFAFGALSCFFIYNHYLEFQNKIEPKSDLEQVVSWLKVSKPEPPQISLPTRDVRSLILSLILEETSELAEGFGEDSIKDFLDLLSSLHTKLKDKLAHSREELKSGPDHVLDALVDLIFVVHNGTFYTGLYDYYPEAFENVVKSNWTKYDSTKEDAEKTKKKYENLGIAVKTNIGTYDKTMYYYTTRLSDGKIMKSHNFVEPQFNL